jgi:hypothetical protein
MIIQVVEWKPKLNFSLKEPLLPNLITMCHGGHQRFALESRVHYLKLSLVLGLNTCILPLVPKVNGTMAALDNRNPTFLSFLGVFYVLS